MSGPANNDGRWTPAEGFTDIRCDEDYEAFYRAQLQAGRKLPPPLDNSTVYLQLPPHLQHGLTQQQQRYLASRMIPSPGDESLGVLYAAQLEHTDDVCMSILYIHKIFGLNLPFLRSLGPHK